MDIRDQKLIQLHRKISSSQVKPRSLKVLQQIIGFITYYTQSTSVGYKSASSFFFFFGAILKVTLAFLAKT